METGRSLRILVTNDDGVFAPGIAALGRALASQGHDLVVVAPLEDRSGTAAGIGPVHLGGGIGFESVTIDGLEGVPVYGIDGLPAMAVITACLGGFGPAPDLVAAGINMGLNTGRAVLHSGTVGAALTAAHFGTPGLAVSLQAGDDPHWSTAASLAALAAPWLAQARFAAVANLNVPNRPLGDLLGFRRARLAVAGTIQSTIVEADGRLQLELGPPSEHPGPDSDVALVASGYATITPLSGIREATGSEASAVVESLLSAWPDEGLEEGIA